MPEETVQVEELLRAPRLAGDYGALQTALNDWLGESAQLKYPLQGDLLSPFVLQDFDGDGEQDAAVFYTTALTSNVCVAFLRKNSGGVWQVSQTVEGLADSVDNVRLAQLQAGGTAQLVVGYAASQDDHYLAVYSYENGEVSAILEQAYEQYLVEDITGGGSEDLILMSTLEDSGVQIELLTVDKDGSFQQVAVMALSGDKFSGCASVAAGLGADGKHYLVLDGWTGISGNNLASVLLCSFAQRLVRKVCPHCAEPYDPPRALLELFGIKETDKANFLRGKGCYHCGNTGYLGRIGIFEVMPVTTEIQEAIVRSAHAQEISAIAQRLGVMSTLAQDAASKVRAGITTVEEALRAAMV